MKRFYDLEVIEEDNTFMLCQKYDIYYVLEFTGNGWSTSEFNTYAEAKNFFLGY